MAQSPFVALLAALLFTSAAGAAAPPPVPSSALPARAWNSWFACDIQINETFVRANADAIVRLGLGAAGFVYVNVDAGWQAGRLPNGSATVNTTRFPSGMKALGDYIHGQGLLYGGYGSRGSGGCDGKPGMLGHEALDAAMYASWGIDYVKVDSCSGTMSHSGAIAEYSLIQAALDAAQAGRPWLYSLCGWLAWYPLAGAAGVGQSWRIGPDALGFPAVLMNMDAAAGASGYAGGPGKFPDVDEVMGPARGRPISFAQTLTQVAFIAVIGSPMLISFDLSAIQDATDPDVAMFLNPEMLAVHWDAGIAQPNYYAKLRGGFFGVDKIPPRTRLPCNASDPTVKWAFLPTLNSTTGYIESVNVPGL